MRIKLILGEYAYLYNGEQTMEAINAYVSSLTKMSFTLKWKDLEEEFITIRRAQDLKQSIDICKKNQQMLRIFILEKSNKSQQFQNQQFQGQRLTIPPNISNAVTPISQQPFFPSNEYCQTFAQIDMNLSQQKNMRQSISASSDMNKSNSDYAMFFEENEKLSYCQAVIATKIEELYPGITDRIIDKMKTQPSLSKNQSEYSPKQQQEIPIQKLNSQQYKAPSLMFLKTFSSSEYQTPQLCQEQELDQFNNQQVVEIEEKDEGLENIRPRTNKLYSFYESDPMKESIPTKKIESQDANLLNLSNQSNQSQQASINQIEQEIYCDYCSDLIKEGKAIFYCPDCDDIHFCEECVIENKDTIHIHQVSLLQK